MPATTTTPTLDRTSLPDAAGHFGGYGGVYVPETLVTALQDLEAAYLKVRHDPVFQSELRHHLKEFAGRPTELYFAGRLTEHCGFVEAIEAGVSALAERRDFDSMLDIVTARAELVTPLPLLKEPV